MSQGPLNCPSNHSAEITRMAIATTGSTAARNSAVGLGRLCNRYAWVSGMVGKGGGESVQKKEDETSLWQQLRRGTARPSCRAGAMAIAPLDYSRFGRICGRQRGALLHLMRRTDYGVSPVRDGGLPLVREATKRLSIGGGVALAFAAIYRRNRNDLCHMA